MKKSLLFLYAAFIAAAMLSCSVSKDMEMYEIPDDNNPESWVSVHVEFNAPSPATKSMEYEHSAYKSVEDRINWFHYYVYDSKGMLAEYGKFIAGNDLVINMRIAQNSAYTMYAVANGTEIFPLPVNETDIVNSVYENQSDGGLNSEVEDSPRLIMTARAPFEIDDDGYKVKLDFRRMTARIGLSFDTSALNSDVSLEIEEVSIVNIPSQVYYFKKNAPDDRLECRSAACAVAPSGLNEKMFFYCYENVQGELLPGNDSQMTKFFSQSSPYNDLCTYICVKGKYSSPRKRGEIMYRLYPGKNASDFSLERNSIYDVTLKFSAEGGVDEVSWRVVTDGLETLATGIELHMGDTDLGENEKVPFKALVLPADASCKHLIWNITNPGIAGFSTADGGNLLSLSQINEIEDNMGPFLIFGLNNGSAVLSAQTTDGTLLAASAEFTVNLAPYPYTLDFEETLVPLWYLNDEEYEVRNISFSKVDAPAGQVPQVSVVSGNDCVEIVSVNRNGIAVKSKGNGTAVVSAVLGTAVAECRFTVSELGITLDKDNLALKAGFSKTLNYTVSPAHAASMGVCLTYRDGLDSDYSNESGHLTAALGNPGINIRADYLNCNDPTQNQGVIRIYVNGHSVCADCSYTIEQPMQVLQNEQICLMNYYNGTQYTEKLIDCPADASLLMSWFRDYSTTGTGGLASTPVSAPSSLELLWDRNACKFSYMSPGTSLNGHYRVNFKLEGDFSGVTYILPGGALGTEMDFIENCASANVDLKFAEMVYIISYMKTDSRNSVSRNRYEYVDELIVRCVKHYKSNVDHSLFADLPFDYTCDGRKFHYSGEGDSHTEYYFDYDITFEKDREYPYIEYSSRDDSYYNSSFIYTGSNAPARHFDGTRISVPSMNNIGNHNGFWYRYVQKNSGLSGFCKDIDWQILYKNLF